MNLYVDIHVLQTVPPSCVNRDDTGSPKTALYGGTRRARVSSQAWKSVMRKEFTNLFKSEQLGCRTKQVVKLVSRELKKRMPEAGEKEIQKAASQALKNAGLSLKSDTETDALFLMSSVQVEKLAELAAEKEGDNKLYKQALKDYPSIDMVLFGRMVAGKLDLKYDAAVQVAHAISTHAVQNEYDYFTAVDEVSTVENGGAGHLDTVEFNSATLYRYATVNVYELQRSLGELTPEVVTKFVEAFVRTMPTGKQNTFANRTMPDMVYIAVRKDQPLNLSGAFEKAVIGRGNGFVEASETVLGEYCKKIYQTYDMNPEVEYLVGTDLWDGVKPVSFSEMLECMEQEIRNRLE